MSGLISSRRVHVHVFSTTTQPLLWSCLPRAPTCLWHHYSFRFLFSECTHVDFITIHVALTLTLADTIHSCLAFFQRGEEGGSGVLYNVVSTYCRWGFMSAVTSWVLLVFIGKMPRDLWSHIALRRKCRLYTARYCTAVAGYPPISSL